MHIEIEKPHRQATDDERNILLNEKIHEYDQFLRRVQEENYYPWSTARHVARELEIPAEASWERLTIQRQAFLSIHTPITSESGHHFRFGIQNRFLAFAHRFDQGYCGPENIAEELTDERHRYLVEGIMEEAIASSQLEGARTTRSEAIILIKSGREAFTPDERMIVNNFRAMQTVDERFVRNELSVAVILELHEMLTDGLIDDAGDTPHLREGDEKVSVTDPVTGDVYHESPSANFMRKELEHLCEFANAKANDYGSQFTHPFMKAVELHFWIGYLHPFTDGNGRLARVLFYWHLMRQGYWAAAFLPISKVIKEAKSMYPMAYQHSEQDNFDLTYFIDFNTRKMEQAMREFEEHRANKKIRLEHMRERLKKFLLNSRQIAILEYLYRNTDQKISTSSHSLLSGVSKQTAISDLAELVNKDFLKKEKKGREVQYTLGKKIRV